MRAGVAIATVVATAAFGACATGAAPGGGAPSVTERFANTTHACAHPIAVRVGWEPPAGGDPAWIPVAPGDEITLIDPGGDDGALVVVADDDAGRELARLLPPGGDGPRRARYFGCAAPEHLIAAPGAGALRVVHAVHGCAPGLRGPAQVSLGGRAVAEVAPGAEATAFVPVGVLAFEVGFGASAMVPERRVDEGVACSAGRVEARVTADGGALAIGWSPRATHAGRLAPLSVLGPAASCPASVRREVRAAGVDATLGPGEVYTLFVPRGRHLVAVVDVQGGDAREIAVDVGADGGIVPARVCEAVGASGAGEERS